MLLLKTTDKFQMDLQEFSPSYYKFFGYPCLVSDYGFNNLIELFDAISDKVNVIGDRGERIIKLSEIQKCQEKTEKDTYEFEKDIKATLITSEKAVTATTSSLPMTVPSVTEITSSTPIIDFLTVISTDQLEKNIKPSVVTSEKPFTSML